MTNERDERPPLEQQHTTITTSSESRARRLSKADRDRIYGSQGLSIFSPVRPARTDDRSEGTSVPPVSEAEEEV